MNNTVQCTSEFCQQFFGFRDNYTKRLTCHLREEERHRRKEKEELLNSKITSKLKRANGKGKM